LGKRQQRLVTKSVPSLVALGRQSNPLVSCWELVSSLNPTLGR
jgi:hypothetical protein